MALQGTIKDFALPDIFQLIGIQKKTGLLTLRNGEDTVTIKFLDGQVVGADTQTETMEERLGSLLVRTGRITEAQLKEALRTQQNTLQRLGYILVASKYISEEELVDALRVQSSQIIYRLFRWHDGTYHFTAVEDLDYDQKHFSPISSETILMEGARMIDEWPIIERRIKSEHMVLRKTDSALALEPEGEAILDGDFDFNLGFDLDRPDDGGAAAAPRAEISVSQEEREVLALLDGKRTVREVCDLMNLGEFDTFRILSELLTRNLVEEVPIDANRAPESPVARLSGRVLFWVAQLVLAGATLISVATLGSNPLTPWVLLAADPTTDELRKYASFARIDRIERAIRVFYLDAGTFPKSLAVLAQNNYLLPPDLQDPWGRAYQFNLSGGGYQLGGWDASGHPSPDLTVSRRFSSLQEMMLSEESGETP